MFNIWAILSLFKEFGYKKVLKLQAVLHIEYLCFFFINQLT